VKLEGPITRDLETEFVMRWNREMGQSRRPALAGWSAFAAIASTPLSTTDDAPAKKVHQLQMLRTISQDAALSPFQTERADIKEAYRRGIRSASRFIYMENQYFRSADLAQWIVQQGNANPGLIVIMVVVASAAADDGTNAITEHGDYLQYDTFNTIVTGLGSARVRLYTMKNRAVHAKFILVDDAWMCVGSANANVRSFELDSELNIQTTEGELVSTFRRRLWAHDLGTDATTVAGWADADFLSQWDTVAAANLTVADQDMAGEGVIAFDYTTVPGTQHGSVPDALAELDASPEGGLFAGEIPADSDTVKIG
jgi:phosphatidylserine/phosphatidylglycerophosphate/cardiolipin synthase-like enzyme